ncbi:uncharacterized protein LOC143275954 isoform X2 [Babylonia areolata]|uniref:uncharacterized protein LOC143275954 isoform X2 n=1 Tax=Babylonia areolata TaxID=304850 RepID=UPI003FD0A168
MLDEEEEGLMSSVDEKRRREAADQQVLDKVLEQVDHHVQDRLTQLADLLTQTLTLVQRRMSTKLFDRDCCKSGSAMTAVLPVLGHILGSVVVLCVLAVSDVPGRQFRWCLDGWASMEEDEDPGLDVSCVSSSEKSSEAAVCNEDRSVSVIGEALSRLVRTSEVKSACLNCLTSFFAVQTTKKGGAATTATGGARGLLKLSDEKAVKFGRVLKLTLRLCRFPRHLKLVRVVRTFSELLQADESGEQKGDGGGGLRRCVSLMAGELQRREKAAEERRRNPSLAEVMEKVQRKAPRWEWYLEYGLAKRDLKNWWLAGFVEFLHARPWVLRTERDMGRVLEVLTQLSQAEDQGPQTLLCAELVSKTFVQLPSAVRGSVLLATYRDTQWSGLPHLSDTDQALTVAFNKLSATTVHKNLQDILPLALHDLLTFTGHAVNTAIGSEGQTSVVVKVLELMPEAMGSVHPLRHPHRSLLCHCLQRVLHCRLLDAREQKNCLNLVSLLVKPTPTPDVTQHAPLLSPAEFLSSSVLPFITLHHASPEPPPISTEFALRLLIGCLEATRSEGRSDWLEGVHPAVVLACLAGVLQECGGMVGEDREVERAVTTKGLVLRVVREMAEHFTLAGMALEGERLGWLQDRCAQCHWMVCAYLSPFLGPADRTKPDMLIAGYVTGALKVVPQNPSALLRLSAVSDDAASQVVQALHSDVHIPRPSLLVSLAQVLPQILVTEVHRVVRVLTALVDTGCVRMDLHKHSLFDHSAFDISAECRREVMVCQLVTEAVVVMVCQEPGFSPPLLHHLAQLMVAALQTLIQPPPKGSKVADRCVLKVALFCQVCAVMSVGAEVMLDPLFVLLLDLLSSLLPHQDPQDPQSQEALSVPEENLRSSLMQGVALIPKKNLRNTLCKKLNCLQKKNSAEENQQATS